MGTNMRTAIAGQTTAGRTTHRLTMLATAVACLFFIAGEDVSVAGIQGSGFTTSYGHIDEFGSIFVNGVEYEISAADIRINGQPATESQLRLGQVVTVKGRINAEGTAGEATEVTATSVVRGPLAQVDLENGTLRVLGQRIRLLPDTFLDEKLHLGGILGLLPGIKVQVSGFPNAAGEIVATRIDLVLGGPSGSRFTGVMQSLNTNANTFRVNDEVVSYSDATLVGTLADGSTVSVEGTVPFGQGVLRATRVEVVSGVGGAVDEIGQVEGLITVFNSAADFALGAQRVATDADTVFVLEGQTLGPDLGVVVHGTYDSTGVLLARQVKVTSLGLHGLLGSAGRVPAGAQVVRLNPAD
jgi:hypothetical protein